MPTIRTEDGTDLFVKDWGTGRPLLFVHSAAVTNDIWHYQHAHFTEAGYRAVAFDRRGHGRSDQPYGGYDPDRLADDLAAVIAARDLHGVTLIAHSLGCAEVVRYLSRHGSSRVSAVVLTGTTTPFLKHAPDNPHGLDRSLMEPVRDLWHRDYPRWVTENVDAFFAPETSQGMKDWGTAMICQIPAHVALACAKTVFETDFRPDCRAIEVPTLILHGTLDASAPIDLTARPTAELIRGSRLIVYDGAPHGLMFTHLERLHADIENFLAETGNEAETPKRKKKAATG